MKKILPLFLILFLNFNIANATLKGDFDWKNIRTEPFEPVQFGHTTLKQFHKKFRYFKKEKLEEGQTILTNKKVQKPYSEIRIGFKNNELDWIEFIFEEKQNLNDFMSLYGMPKNINKAHSDYYNYYDYDFFNVSTDKKGEHFYSLTLFNVPEIDENYKKINDKLPNISELSISKYFAPGRYLEQDFAEQYPDFFPILNKDGSKTYTIKNNIVSKYNNAKLIFKNGLLNLLIIEPKKLTLSDIIENYGLVDKVYTIKNGKVVYEYDYFTVVTDSKNNVINIGIFATL